MHPTLRFNAMDNVSYSIVWFVRHCRKNTLHPNPIRDIIELYKYIYFLTISVKYFVTVFNVSFSNLFANASIIKSFLVGELNEFFSIFFLIVYKLIAAQDHTARWLIQFWLRNKTRRNRINRTLLAITYYAWRLHIFTIIIISVKKRGKEIGKEYHNRNQSKPNLIQV